MPLLQFLLNDVLGLRTVAHLSLIRVHLHRRLLGSADLPPWLIGTGLHASKVVSLGLEAALHRVVHLLELLLVGK